MKNDIRIAGVVAQLKTVVVVDMLEDWFSFPKIKKKSKISLEKLKFKADNVISELWTLTKNW